MSATERTNATTEGRLIASAGERCAIFVYSHFLLNSNPTVPSTVTSLQLAARRAAKLAQATAAAQTRLGTVSARKHTRAQGCKAGASPGSTAGAVTFEGCV